MSGNHEFRKHVQHQDPSTNMIKTSQSVNLDVSSLHSTPTFFLSSIFVFRDSGGTTVEAGDMQEELFAVRVRPVRLGSQRGTRDGLGSHRETVRCTLYTSRNAFSSTGIVAFIALEWTVQPPKTSFAPRCEGGN